MRAKRPATRPSGPILINTTRRPNSPIASARQTGTAATAAYKIPAFTRRAIDKVSCTNREAYSSVARKIRILRELLYNDGHLVIYVHCVTFFIFSAASARQTLPRKKRKSESTGIISQGPQAIYADLEKIFLCFLLSL